MNSNTKTKFKRALAVLSGVLFAMLMSAPYVLYREQIQEMALVGYLGVAVMCAISNVSVLLPSRSTLIVVAAASTLNPVLCV